MIYFLRHIETGLIKIGCTNSLKTRLYALQKEHGALEVLGLTIGYEKEETELHNQFNDYRADGILTGREWFHPAPVIMGYVAKHTTMNLPLPIGNRSDKHTRRQPKTQTKYYAVRTSPTTEAMVNRIAAMMYLETGVKPTADSVLMHAFRIAFPEHTPAFDRTKRNSR